MVKWQVVVVKERAAGAKGGKLVSTGKGGMVRSEEDQCRRTCGVQCRQSSNASQG